MSKKTKPLTREHPSREPESSGYQGGKVFNLHPRNDEQKEAFQALLDPDKHLVILVGKAGSGKTLLALAAGLHQVQGRKLYERVIVGRPVIPLGDNDIGFTPGTIEEKLFPWTQPIYDNLEFLLKLNPRSSQIGSNPGMLTQTGILEVQALAYIRGRSIPQQYMIIDEAQNLTQLEVKTILTRAGEGTKIVLTGDPEQIDKPGLTAKTNGLSYAAEKFAAYPEIATTLHLKQCVRSKLAALAAEIL